LEGWGNTQIKNNGSGWLRGLPKQGEVIQAHRNHTAKRCALELSFARHDILHPFKDLVNILKRERWIQIALFLYLNN
jgi:hypothetical protein